MRYRRYIHPFPARMAPSIAVAEIPTAEGMEPLRVLDPMVGSGTTLVAARRKGHRAIGFDTDFMALLLADVGSADIDSQATLAEAERVVGRALEFYRRLPLSQAYPVKSDAETKKFIRFWFDPTNRRQLRALADAIFEVKNKRIQKILWCAFSRLIITKSRGASLAKDLPHGRPHRVKNRAAIRPLSVFTLSVKTVIKNATFADCRKGFPKASVRRGDARELKLASASIDIVITSPPYLNAIDYIRCHKFSLVWMRYALKHLRTLRASNVGSSNSRGVDYQEQSIQETLKSMGDVERLPNNKKGLLARYILDMRKVMKEIRRVLVKGGKCILVIGDCTINGVFISNSSALIDLALRHGFTLEKHRIRKLPSDRRYMPPPSSSNAGKWMRDRMRHEIIITLKAA